MYDILNKLNKVEGVHGSIIMGKDGLVVAADLGDDSDENTVAAIGSSIINSLTSALARFNMGELKRFVVTGRTGKVLLADAGNVVVVLIVDLEVNIGMAWVEIKEAINEINEKIKM